MLTRVFLIVLALPLFTVRAQTIAQSDHSARLGVTAGVSAATVNGSQSSRRLGVSPGAYVAFPLSGPVSLEAGIAYAMKGATYDIASMHSAFEMDYLQVPLLLRVGFLEASPLAPFVRGGVALGYQTSCRLQYFELQTMLRKTCREYDATNSGGSVDRRRFDVSGVVGGGVSFTTGARRLWVATQYEHGLRKVSPSLETKNRMLSLLTGVEWRVP